MALLLASALFSIGLYMSLHIVQARRTTRMWAKQRGQRDMSEALLHQCNMLRSLLVYMDDCHLLLQSPKVVWILGLSGDISGSLRFPP